LLDSIGIDYQHNKAEEIIRIGSAHVYCRSAEHPDRLRGPNLSWGWIEEAAMCKADTWKVLLGRLRVGEGKAWITTTPRGFNWVYSNFVESHDKNYELITTKTTENFHLPEVYIDSLKDSYTGAFAKQEIDGEFVQFEGLVYDEFSIGGHCCDSFNIPDSWPRFRAIDFGFNNPFGCLWAAVHDDIMYVYDEYYETKQLLKYHAEMIKSRDKYNDGEIEMERRYVLTVADHDAQDNAELRHHGINTVNAKKDVMAGIQKVKARLKALANGKPRLVVFNNCKHLISEFQHYRWHEAKEGRNEKEEPVKEYDHLMDSLRYMCMAVDKNKIRSPKLSAGVFGL
jgi:phage terminase large subunit